MVFTLESSLFKNQRFLDIEAQAKQMCPNRFLLFSSVSLSLQRFSSDQFADQFAFRNEDLGGSDAVVTKSV